MTNLKLDQKLVYSIVFSVILLSLIYLVFNIVKFFVPAATIALFILYVTRPVYKVMEQLFKIRTLAFMVTMAIVLVPMGYFFSYFISVASFEITALSHNPQVQQMLSEYSMGFSFSELTTQLFSINTLDITQYKSQITVAFKMLAGIAVTVSSLLLQLIISILMAYYVLKDREKLHEAVMNVIPKEHRTFAVKVMGEIHISLKNLFLGIFLTTTSAGIFSYLIYSQFNISYPALLSALTALLTLIPVIGAWLVYIPLTGYVLLQQSSQAAIMFIVLNLVLVSTIPDFLFKPFISARERKTNMLIILIGFLGGAKLFGPLGLILGPIIMSIFLSFFYVLNDRVSAKR